MVVPGNPTAIQKPDCGCSSGLMESSDPGFEEEQDVAGVELEEVRKLQELVRRLEVQNQTLRNRGNKPIHNSGYNNHSASSNVNERLSCEGVSHPDLRLDPSGELSGREFELSPPQDTSSSYSSEDMSPLPVTSRLGEEEGAEGFGGPCMGFLTLPCSNGPEPAQGQPPTPESPSQESFESETLAESDSGVDQTALDEVDVLDLEDECAEVDDGDSWYVSIHADHIVVYIALTIVYFVFHLSSDFSFHNEPIWVTFYFLNYVIVNLSTHQFDVGLFLGFHDLST